MCWDPFEWQEAKMFRLKSFNCSTWSIYLLLELVCWNLNWLLHPMLHTTFVQHHTLALVLKLRPSLLPSLPLCSRSLLARSFLLHQSGLKSFTCADWNFDVWCLNDRWEDYPLEGFFNSINVFSNGAERGWVWFMASAFEKRGKTRNIPNKDESLLLVWQRRWQRVCACMGVWVCVCTCVHV